MRDLRGALALARQKVLETSGNSGNSGNTAEKVSRNKQLPDLHVVSTAADAVATVETKAEAVATVASPSELVETPSITDESESEQQLTQPVASVSSVSTENGANPEELDERTWWDDVMAATERSAILEYEAGMPRAWADKLARIIEGPVPTDVGADRWQVATDRALAFSDKWASEAHKLGWGVEELFAFSDQDHEHGLAFLLAAGGEVIALDGAGADIRVASGVQRYHRPTTSSIDS